MNYKLIYENLITRAKTRILEEYTESHHIIPKCIGGTNDKDNLVDLTPEEHYLAHLLLVKIYPTEPKLIYAANMMTVGTQYAKRNNKTFGWIRRKIIEVERGKIVSQETRKLMSDSSKKRERITCPHCGKSGLNGNMNRWHFDNCSKGPNKVVHTLSESHKESVSKGLLNAKWSIIKCEFCEKTGKSCIIKTHQKFCKSNPNRVKKVELELKHCIYCGKQCSGTNLKRWHNDNCKMKPL